MHTLCTYFNWHLSEPYIAYCIGLYGEIKGDDCELLPFIHHVYPMKRQQDDDIIDTIRFNVFNTDQTNWTY